MKQKLIDAALDYTVSETIKATTYRSVSNVLHPTVQRDSLPNKSCNVRLDTCVERGSSARCRPVLQEVLERLRTEAGISGVCKQRFVC